ncbi:MAG: SH3 domain-containing protein [Planctomycetota bacterium]|jgi:SH3-like domain-containing protein
MSRTISSLLLVGLCLGFGVASGGEPEVVAEPDEQVFAEPKAGSVSARTLNVRVGPSIEKRLITTLRRGRQVNVVGSKGKWLKIELPSDITVWVVGKYVTLVEGQALPTTGTVNAAKVRLRAGGDYKAPILRLLPMDTQLEVTERSGEWLRVKAPPATYAWVHGSYIKLGAGDTLPTATGTETTGTETTGTETTGTETTGTETTGTETTGTETIPTTPVIRGAGVKAFADAEKAYQAELAKAEQDLIKVFLMYYSVSATEGVHPAVKAKCEQRMKEIAVKMPAADRKRIKNAVKGELQKRLAEIERARREALAQLPRVAPKYTAVGVLERAPEVPGIPGTHKLTMSGVLLYYLQPAHEGLDLQKFVGRKVGISGSKRYVRGWGIQVIDVTGINYYQTPPSTRATFGGTVE